MIPPVSPPARGRRWGVAVLLLALAALPLASLAIYRTVVNQWLAGEQARSIANRRPERARLSWRRATSRWPGDLVVEGFSLSVQTATARFRIEADRVEGWPGFLDLATRRTLDLSRITASGVTFFVSRRSAPTDVPTARQALGPSFPEFSPGSGLPVAPAQGVPLPGPRTGGFRFRLRAVEIEDLRELWVEEFHYQGPGRARVDLDIQTRRHTTLGSSFLDLGPGGRVELGANGLFAEVAAHLEARIETFVPRDSAGWRLLDHTIGTLRARAEVESGGRLFDLHVRPQVPWLALGGGHGPVRFDLSLDRGDWQPGSAIEGMADDLQARFFDYVAEGSGPWRWRVDEGNAPRLSIRLNRYRLLRRGDSLPHVVGQDLDVSFAGASAHGLEAFQGLVPRRLDIPSATTPDVRVFNGYLPDTGGLRLVAGSARLQAHIETTDDDAVLRGAASIAGRHIAAVIGDQVIHGEFDLALAARRIEWALPRLDVGGTTIDLRSSPKPGGGDGGGKPWDGRVEIAAGQITGGAEPRLETGLTFRFRDSGPFVAWLDDRRNVAGWLARMAHIEGPAGAAHLTVTPKAFRLRDAHLASEDGRAELRAHLGRRAGSPSVDALVYARWRGLDLALAQSGGSRTWKLLRPRAWFDSQVPPDPFARPARPSLLGEPPPSSPPAGI